MRSNTRIGRIRASRTLAAAAVVTSLAVLTACSGGGSSGDSAGATKGATNASGKTTVTMWSWTPDTQNEVNLYEKAHPNIKVKLVNAGQGTPEYTKLRTALKSSSGAPDVVQIEFQYIPTFSITKNLVDLSKYGAKNVQGLFPDWVWNLVSQKGAVYGIPWDTGPMALMYRADIFKKYGITVPTTWAEFATAAAKLHAASPSTYLTDFPPGQGGQMLAEMAQAGARPHKILSPTELQLNFNSPAAKKWASYWGDLVKRDIVATDPDFTSQWYKGLSSGRYATWLSAAWGPIFLQGTAKNTSGKWRIAELPQWNAGEHVSANWGGSTLAVTTQSKVPKEAADLATWLMTNKQSATMFSVKQFLFPSLKSVLADPAYVDQKVPFFGGQQVNKFYAKVSDQVAKDYTWSPFQDYIYTQMSSIVGKAVTSKGDLPASLDQLQSTVTNYAKSQGFTVKAG